MQIHETDMCTRGATPEECRKHYWSIVQTRAVIFLWAACTVASAAISSYIIADNITANQSLGKVLAMVFMGIVIYGCFWFFVTETGKDLEDITSDYVHTNRRDIRRARRASLHNYDLPPPD